MRLVADRIHYAYRPGRDVLSDVSLTLDEGRVLFVLGANGSGKTTLLDCLAGVRTPHTGRVTMDGTRLSELKPRNRAGRIGVVPQVHEPVFSYTVGEAVLMGRAPHLGLFSHPGKDDWAAVARALEAVGIAELRTRPYTQISGGERQLVLIARGLVQGAGCLLMDEPAAHLDPHHQHDILHVVRQLASEGYSFVVTSHHPNNALLYANGVVFLADGASIVAGPPDTAIDEGNLRAAYGMDFEIVRGVDGARAVIPRISPQPGAS